MGFFKRKAAAAEEPVSPEAATMSEKLADDVAPEPTKPIDASEEDSAAQGKTIDTGFQGGVAAAEATTLAWPKTHLIIAYVM